MSPCLCDNFYLHDNPQDGSRDMYVHHTQTVLLGRKIFCDACGVVTYLLSASQVEIKAIEKFFCHEAITAEVGCSNFCACEMFRVGEIDLCSTLIVPTSCEQVVLLSAM